jgi:transposase
LPSLKAQLLKHIGRRLAAGERAGEIAQSLGLSDQTMSQWCAHLRRRAEKPRLRAVKVASEVAAVGRGLTLQGPGGLRVEGLSVEELAALWRKLG